VLSYLRDERILTNELAQMEQSDINREIQQDTLPLAQQKFKDIRNIRMHSTFQYPL